MVRCKHGAPIWYWYILSRLMLEKTRSTVQEQAMYMSVWHCLLNLRRNIVLNGYLWNHNILSPFLSAVAQCFHILMRSHILVKATAPLCKTGGLCAWP